MDPCKWNYLNAFFSWFRCLEMLLQVQWQRNFLTSCSLLLKCHDWWWLKFDGEHQISPQVLHGAQGWTFPHLCIVVFRSVRILRAAIYSKCAGSETEFLAMKMCCLLFLCTEGERKRLEVSSLDYRESWVPQNFNRCDREVWTELHDLLGEGGQEHACEQMLYLAWGACWWCVVSLGYVNILKPCILN